MISGSRPEHARRLAYLYETVDVQRARRHVQRLQELYAGRCQLCLYDPAARYGLRLCHGDDIQWLSHGGEDELENIVLICPTTTPPSTAMTHHSTTQRSPSPSHGVRPSR